MQQLHWFSGRGRLACERITRFEALRCRLFRWMGDMSPLFARVAAGGTFEVRHFDGWMWCQNSEFESPIPNAGSFEKCASLFDLFLSDLMDLKLLPFLKMSLTKMRMPWNRLEVPTVTSERELNPRHVFLRFNSLRTVSQCNYSIIDILQECLFIHRLTENISKLQLRGNILHMDVSFWIVCTPYSASEVMVLDCNVFRSRSKFYGFSHCNSWVIVLVNCQAKICCWNV